MSIPDIRRKITPILRKYGVTHASVFGSAARGEHAPESDVDILVSIGTPMGLFTYMRMIGELEEALGRKVDVITDKSVNKHLKPHIEQDLQTVYEK